MKYHLYSDTEAAAFRKRLARVAFPTTPEALWQKIGMDPLRLTVPLGGASGWTWATQTRLSEHYWIRYYGEGSTAGLTKVEIYRAP